MKGIGITLLIAGGISFGWAAPKMDAVRSGFGQIAMAMSSESAQQGQLIQAGYYGGILAMVMGGVLLLAGVLSQNQARAPK